MPDKREEFAEFVAGSGQQLFRVAFLLTGDVARAEDLYQDAMVRAYTSWRRIRRDDAYRYARRIMINLHTDWWRAPLRRRERATASVPDLAGTDDPAGPVVEREWLAGALQRLSRRERAILVLRYFADLSVQDTAAELKMPTGTVKSCANRALAKLRLSVELHDAARPTSGAQETETIAHAHR